MNNKEKYKLTNEDFLQLMNNNEEYIRNLIDRYPFFFSLFLDFIEFYFSNGMRDIILYTRHEVEDIEITFGDITRNHNEIADIVNYELTFLEKEDLNFISTYVKNNNEYMSFSDVFKTKVIYEIYKNKNLNDYLKDKRDIILMKFHLKR